MKMNEPNLWILCGTPGMGKSTFAKNFFNPNDSIIVSRDEIRFSMISSKEDYFKKEKEVFKKFIKTIKDAFDKVDNVIVDATHINERSRNKLLDALGKDFLGDKRINVIYMDVLLEIAIERNSKREELALVPESAIEQMFENYTYPTYNEKYYYDNIYSVDETGRMVRKEKM